MEKSTFELIYDVVKQIPKGKVATYGQVAALAGNKRWARVVGYALHANPDPAHIPCHRVVNREGAVSEAFAFGGGNRQAELLRKEGVEVAEKKVDLEKYRWNCVTMEMMETE
ncbi:MAG: MGMT family protein [Lachnospiraceae bacterium]